MADRRIDQLTDIGSVVSGDLLAVYDVSLSDTRKATPAQVKAAMALVKADVGLANVDNTSDANKPVSTAQQTALNLKANLASPTFTGTVSGITSTMVGLGNVDNTSDVNKPVSTAQQAAINARAPLTVISTVFPSGLTTTSDTLVDTGLGFTMGANETWQFEFIIQHGCNGTGGLKFELSGPAGHDHRSRVIGLTSATTAFTSQILTTGNETAVNINTVNSSGQGSEIKGIVVNGVTAGNFRLRYRSIVSGQISSIFKETYCIARRIS